MDCAWVLVPPTRRDSGYLPLYSPSRSVDLLLSVKLQATCVPLSEARREHSPTTSQQQCPAACSSFASCDKCVAARFGRPVFEGGYDECYWSTALRQVQSCTSRLTSSLGFIYFGFKPTQVEIPLYL